MALTCHNSQHGHGPDTHEIPDGARSIVADVRIDWGTADVRDPWSGTYAFCSFGCFEEWAGDRAVEHDKRVLVDGVPPPGDET